MEVASRSNRKKIAVLSGDLSYEDTYPDQLWKSIYNQALLKSCDLHFLLGRSRPETDPEDPSTALFRLTKGIEFDGIIVSPALITSRDKPHFEAILAQLPKVPTVFLVEGDFEVGKTIGVDNASGMFDLMDHLIKVHNRKKIAHLSGPLSHLEAKARYDCWKTSLLRAGLPVDDSWSVECDWKGENTEACVKELWDKMGGFDALVCSNDAPALLSIPILRRMGINIPEEVSVTGFDGLNSTFFSDPPLTTVEQPFLDQLSASFDYLLGPEPSQKSSQVMIPSRFIARSSCGCTPKDWTRHPLAAHVFANGSPHEFQDWLRQNNPSTTALCSIEQELYALYLQTNEVKFKEMIDTLRAKQRFDLHQSLVESQRLADILNSCSKKLSTMHHTDQVVGLIEDVIGEFGISMYCLSLVSDEVGKHLSFASDTSQSILPSAPPILAHVESLPRIKPGTRVFDSERHYHPSWHQYTEGNSFYVLPLVSEKDWFGILAIEANPNQSLLMRSLQELLSGYFDRTYNYAALIEEAAKERAKSLYETARMAELSQLIAGISHELNTPLGTSLTTLGFAAHETSELEKNFTGNSLTKQVLSAKIDSLKKSEDLIERNLMRVTGLIQNFKKTVTDYQSFEVVTFNIDKVINETIANILSESTIKGIVFRTKVMPDLEIRSRINPLFEISKAIIDNAIIHGKIDKTDLIITISAEPSASDEHSVVLRISNNGAKIGPEIFPHIFKPFYGTKLHKGGGGLGLYIAQNMVKQGLGGEISATSTDDQTEFVISFPRWLAK